MPLKRYGPLCDDDYEGSMCRSEDVAVLEDALRETVRHYRHSDQCSDFTSDDGMTWCTCGGPAYKAHIEQLLGETIDTRDR